MSYAAWVQQAESDLAAAKELSGANHHSQAVWFAAQAVEKGHKAILGALGLQYEEKHFRNLGHHTSAIATLLPPPLHEPLDPDIALKVAALEARAAESRYPLPVPGAAGTAQLVAPVVRITASQTDVKDAEVLLQWCRERVDRAVRAADAMKP